MKQNLSDFIKSSSREVNACDFFLKKNCQKRVVYIVYNMVYRARHAHGDRDAHRSSHVRMGDLISRLSNKLN